MGKAANHPADQFIYVKNRIHMLNQVVSTMDPEQIDMDDYNRVLEMLEQLHTKMTRFKKDWQEE
ncbi:SE1561 family protein [Halobacillus sp. Marseille-Q1614]|uniref:SE1561 family protein n=1 Tax=Halobacillus sp. Marseille-Q1614 TaxID=2709134 RepID=UPI0015706AC4|nr:SE1561 family protein [Halobacillus sp. Marseille-Q1614]